MMRTGKLVLLFLITLTFHSCFKKDEMIAPYPRGNVSIDTIQMTKTYLNQVYFRLDSGEVVSSDIKTSFDLGFECSPTGWHILLNTSDFMKVADLGTAILGQQYSTEGLKWMFDKSDGNPDSIAIGQWFSVNGKDTVSNNHLYAVDRGLDEFGNALGIFQVKFDSLKHNSYYFRYAPIKGGAIISGMVTKDPLVRYLWFSLVTGSVVHNEPPKTGYDLLFTQYTTLLFTDEGAPYPYLVTGVLLNPDQVEVAVDSINDFYRITQEVASGLNFSKSLDAVGYDWKILESTTTGAYTIRKNRTYIIHQVSGAFYKFRFIGFYNEKGEKGYPVFEYQQLLTPQ